MSILPKKEPHAADRKCGAEGLQSMRCVAAELSGGGRWQSESWAWTDQAEASTGLPQVATVVYYPGCTEFSLSLMPPTRYKLCFIVLTGTVFCFVFTNWRSVATPSPVGLCVPFVQRHLLPSCLCAQCGKPGCVSNVLLLFSIYLQWPMINLFSFFVIFILFNWRIIALQCRVGFSVQQRESAINIHMSPPPVRSTFDVTIRIVLGCRELYPCKMVNLVVEMTAEDLEIT